MKRHYLWLAIAPVIAAGGIWAYAQEPNLARPYNTDSARYRQKTQNTISPSPQGQSLATRPNVGSSSAGIPAQQPQILGYPAPAAYPSYSLNSIPMPPGFPAIASFPGQPGSKPELLELEDGKFKIVTEENPTQEDWQADAQAKQQLSSAIQKFKSSDNDESELEESRKLITSYLDAQFEHDITKRENQINDLQKQIDRLKSQLDKRKTSKEKMITMRLMLMENESNGLGFPPAWNALPSTSNGPANFYVPPNNAPMPAFVPPQSVYANPSFPSASLPGFNPGNPDGVSSQMPSVDLPEKD